MKRKIIENIKKNYIKYIFCGAFAIFIIGYCALTTLHYLKFKDYIAVDATITNIEQYEYKESTKNNIGVKIEYSYNINEKEYKYEYKGALTDKVYDIGDNKTIYYSSEDPEDIILDKTYEMLILGINIFLLLSFLFYFIFIFRKKSSTLYIVFVIVVFGSLFSIINIINMVKTSINYEKVEAIVDRTYTYTVSEPCMSGSSTPTCNVSKTGALYSYEVNNIIYEASQLDVSSKTKYGDKKTIYYSSKNPMYYSFNSNKNLVIYIFSMLIFTSLAIITNPFTKKIVSKKQFNKKKKTRSEKK